MLIRKEKPMGFSKPLSCVELLSYTSDSNLLLLVQKMFPMCLHYKFENIMLELAKMA